jgi:hypothetical protein
MKPLSSVTAKIIIILFLSIFLMCSHCYSFQNEPDGFGGIKWGQDFKSIKERLIHQEAQDGFFAGEKDIRAYVKSNDNKMLGTATLKDIYYYFWKDKFICVEIFTNGSSNFASLKNFCFERYGKNIEGTAQANKNFNTYTWKGNVAGIGLFHYKDDSGFDQGILRMYSQKMMKQLAGKKEKNY